MINLHDFYNVTSAMVPQYVPMILAYASVRWWKIFTVEQISGINRFISTFSVPFLCFHFVAVNNPYEMNFVFIAADTLQKGIVIVVLLVIWVIFFRKSASLLGSSPLDWFITLYSLACLPNNLIVGVPLLVSMYGEDSGSESLMVQIVVLQIIVWYILLLILFEFRAARLLIAGNLPVTAADIASIKVESNGFASRRSKSVADSTNAKLVFGGRSRSTGELQRNATESAVAEVGSDKDEENKETIAANETLSTSVMMKLVLNMVLKKLLRNPTTWASVAGLIWSFVAFRWNLTMPKIIANSISILSNTGFGIIMFSLGLFMGMQPKLIGCGKWLALFSMGVRFMVGPAAAAAASIAIGLRGDLLRISIVQAALPQGILPFVYAKDYDNHPTILSTSLIFGMLVALPVDLLYYTLLGM